MNRRDIIRILAILVAALWMAMLVMPRRYALIDELNMRYYDKAMASQEFMIRKELKKLSANKHVSQEVTLDYNEALAKNLWATFRAKDAAVILQGVLAAREKLNKGDDQKSVNTMLTLAGIYRDLNQIDDSAFWYRKVWHWDQANVPANDSHLMRDEANFALLDYLRGDIEKDETKRQQCFKDSLIHTRQAIEMWHKQKNPDMAALANLLYLQYIAYRDIGDYGASRQAFGEMKYINKQLQRAYNLPWK